MQIEHIAVSSNTEHDSDAFFIELLGLKKARSFNVAADLMEKFFSINKEQKIIRYENESVGFEVFITEDDSKAKDIFTHSCLIIEDRDNFTEKAKSMGYTTIIVPREDRDSYYLFIKDLYGNLYEVK